jgi:hypothetical protein
MKGDQHAQYQQKPADLLGEEPDSVRRKGECRQHDKDSL